MASHDGGTNGSTLKSAFMDALLQHMWLETDNSCFSMQRHGRKENTFSGTAHPQKRENTCLVSTRTGASIGSSCLTSLSLCWLGTQRFDVARYSGIKGQLIEGQLLDPEEMQKRGFYAQRLDPSPHQVLAITDLKGKELQMVAYQKLLDPTSKAPVVFVKNDKKLVWNQHPDYELSPDQSFDMPKGFATYLVVLVGKHAKVLVPWMSHGDVAAKKTKENDFFIEIIDAEQTTIMVNNSKEMLTSLHPRAGCTASTWPCSI